MTSVSKLASVTAPWWLEPSPVDEASGGDQGLTSTEAQQRQKRFGPNLFRDDPRRPVVVQLLARFADPMVLILLVASVISVGVGDVTSFGLIVGLVLLSVLLDFSQEYRAQQAADKLRATVAVRATVLRDGIRCDVAVREVVPGDIFYLCAGDLIPADARVLYANDLFLNQAALTGEPYPIEKRPGELAASATEIGDAANAVFMGTSVVSGSARAMAMKTGKDTAIGAIAERIMRPAPPTAFDIGIRHFGMLVMRVTVLLVLFVLLVNAAFGRPWLESFLFAIALAVGLTPELLPMVTSVTLARGAVRMASRHVIVKRLTAIQNLGAMDVLCTDKTGTLTEARISLERILDLHGADSERAFELAYLNSHFETGLKSVLDEAILNHRHTDMTAWRKIDEVPFDFERRRVSVLLERSGERYLIVKGAPEDVITLCDRYECSESNLPVPLDETALALARRQCSSLLEQGMRVLGVAWRQVPPDHDHAIVSDESALTFAGFVVFLDPPKVGAAAALKALSDSGIAIKIVTGDSELVTRHVCETLGIPVTGILTGAQISALDSEALGARVADVNLFCRVNPSQKERIIRTLRAQGHVVGYLGDGINDAPSLHAADVGFSVDSAVDVAKAAADIILLESDLFVLHEAVKEGRRTFANVMKYLLMGTSSNFGNMFSMAAATLFLPFLPMLPTQILLNNVLYDLSELAIPLDHVDPDDVARPRTWDIGFIRKFMLTIGPLSSVFDFLTFFVLLRVFHADAVLFHTGWFVESLATQVLVIFVIRTRGNPLRSRPHAALVAASLAVVAAAIVLPFTPLGSVLGFTPPPLSFLAILVGMSFGYLLLVEASKRWLYARIRAA